MCYWIAISEIVTENFLNYRAYVLVDSPGYSVSEWFDTTCAKELTPRSGKHQDLLSSQETYKIWEQ